MTRTMQDTRRPRFLSRLLPGLARVVALTTALTTALTVAFTAPDALAQQIGLGNDRPTASAIRWVELGPAPIAGAVYAGRISAVVCSPSDPDRYYVAGADGGVWRTRDGGTSWTALTDRMPTTSIGALALDPSDENVLYAGTGEANYANHSRYGLGIFKSVNGGDDWVHLAQDTFGGRCISRIAIHPTLGDILYASVTRAGGFPNGVAAKGHPDAQGDVGVFKSLDGGVSWARLTNLPNVDTHDVLLDPVDPTVLYAAVGDIFGLADNGIYKSSDSGASWIKLTSGLPTGGAIGRLNIAVAPSDRSRLYALVSNPSGSTGGGASTQGTYRSDDAGATWSSLPALGSVGSFGWYYSLVSVAPTNPDRVFMGGLTLKRSLDGGASFSTVTPPHVDLHAAAFDAANRLVVGDDGGVHRTTNLGNNWTSHNTGLGTIQFYAGLSRHPTNDLIVFGGTQDNGTNRRTTDDKQWTQVFGGDGGWTQIDPSDPQRVFVEFQGSGNLYRSLNGGDSFSFSGSGISGSDRNCFLPPYLIDPQDPSRMLYGTYRIYRSLDGGSTWNVLSGDITTGTGAIRSLAMAPSDPDVIYAATNDGLVQVSLDGGQTFQQRLSGNPGWPRTTREIFVHPQEPLTAWLAVASFGTEQILRTTDGGQNWIAIDQALPDVPVNVVAVRPGPPDELFAGTDTGLLHSADGGLSWQRYGRDAPRAPVIDIRLRDDGRLLVATQGRGAWEVLVDTEAK